jgi:hypothetical protein
MLRADFPKIVLKYSNEVHLLRYLTPLVVQVLPGQVTSEAKQIGLKG